MRAVVYERYGPPEVLHLEDVEQPAPGDDEVLVKVHATTVNRTDIHIREANRSNGFFFSMVSRLVSGLRRPRRRILGNEFAGVVETVGSAVREFAVGDRVFGRTGLGFGAHAEFLCVPAGGHIAHMPEGAGFPEAAAASDGPTNALSCFRGAGLRKGQSIVIYGASGSIGTAAVQLARHFDLEITAVCGTRNLELVRALGAGRVIDYSREDFTRNGETYDAIFDAAGKHSFKGCKNSLKPGGTYLPTDGARNLPLALWTSRFGNKRVIFPRAPRLRKQDVQLVKELMESGEYRPVIDRSYALEQVVEATRYVEAQHKTGNVVLIVGATPP